MDNVLKVFILICGLLFTGTVVGLLLKKKLSERNSIIWFIGSFVVVILSLMPETLQVIANFIGIDYPPSLLFLLSILILLYIVFKHSVQISLLNDRIKELTQHIALLQTQKKAR